MAETDEVELLFTKEGMTERRKVKMPFKGDTWHEELVTYKEIEERKGIKLTVDKIEPEKTEKGVLKSLRFHVTHYLTSLEREHNAPPPEPYKRGIEIQEDFISCRFSKDILVETANWLIDKDYLKEEDAPIDLGASKRYLINSVKKHKDGYNFSQPKELKNGLFIETKYSHKACVDYAERLLENVGCSKHDLKVIGLRSRERNK